MSREQGARFTEFGQIWAMCFTKIGYLIRLWATCCTRLELTLGNMLHKIVYDFGLVWRRIEAFAQICPTLTFERGSPLSRASLKEEDRHSPHLLPLITKSVPYSEGTGQNEYQSDPFLFMHFAGWGVGSLWHRGMLWNDRCPITQVLWCWSIDHMTPSQTKPTVRH